MRIKDRIRDFFSKPKSTSNTDAIESTGTTHGKKLCISSKEKCMLAEELTPRECDTYLLLLEGYTLKETAKKLGIEYSTANTYQTAVYRKLHVNSRAELIINYRDIGKSKNEEKKGEM